MYMYNGAYSLEDKLEKLQVGYPITYTDEFDYLSESRMTGRALDNRIGGYMIAQVLKRLNERRSELKVNVAVLNSVQEEVGGYRARMMSYRIDPDMAFVTDVTTATDHPGIEQNEY